MFKNCMWKLWTRREKRILLYRMIRMPDLGYWNASSLGWQEAARGFFARTPAGLESMYREKLSVQWPMSRIRSYESSQKGLHGLRYTREDYDKMVEWMITRPRLGYGRPAYKNGSGWHKMALFFPGRTAYGLYQKYTSFVGKVWPLKDIRREALRRKLERLAPVVE